MNIGSCISRLERRPKAGREDGLVSRSRSSRREIAEIGWEGNPGIVRRLVFSPRIGRRGRLMVIGFALGIAVAAAPAPMVHAQATASYAGLAATLAGTDEDES